jgi:hypothetical protein
VRRRVFGPRNLCPAWCHSARRARDLLVAVRCDSGAEAIVRRRCGGKLLWTKARHGSTTNTLVSAGRGCDCLARTARQYSAVSVSAFASSVVGSVTSTLSAAVCPAHSVFGGTNQQCFDASLHSRCSRLHHLHTDI